LVEARQATKNFNTKLAHSPALLVTNACCPDPDDDRIVETAVASKSQFIVTGDDHLLSLGSFGASGS
jgi:predicted nucleic acid-binding protein